MERLTWESCNGGFYAEPDTIEQSDFDGHVLYSGEAVNRLALLENILEKHNIEPEQLDEVLTERNAAIKELYDVNNCVNCKNGGGGINTYFCGKFKAANNPSCCDNYEWRGVPKEELK